MNRTRERMVLLTAGLCALAALVDFLLFRKTGLLSTAALLPLCGLAALTPLIAYVRLRLARIADDEQRDEALARKERPDATLFAAGGSAPFTAARSLEQFEKFVLPAAPVVFALGLGAGAWFLWRMVAQSLLPPTSPLLAASFLGGLAFVLFLMSRLLVGMSREDKPALPLRGPGVAAGLLCFASLAAAVAAVAAGTSGDARFDSYTSYGLAGVAGILAVEQFFGFVLCLYSPRHRRPFLTAYESRIGQFAADPSALARNFAQAVDYQFGFSVSDSWFYRLLRNALAPLVIFQLLALYAMSCLVFLGPDEGGVLERFGRPVKDHWHLASGFHLKLPWPFETVERVPEHRVMTLYLGFEPGAETNRPATITWTVPHYKKEDMYLVAIRPDATNTATTARTDPAAPVSDSGAVAASFVSVNIPVEYRVTNLLQYVYGAREPSNIIQMVSSRALTETAAHHELSDFLAPDRAQIAAALQDEIQRQADEIGLGVKIQFVGIAGAHPPVQVAPAFEDVVSAIEQKQTTIDGARAYTNQIIPLARASAATIRSEAEAYRVRRTVLAASEVYQFQKRLASYRAAPQVFRTFQYLETLQDSITNARKYIIDAPASKEILYFNFEEKPYQDLLDLGSQAVAPENPK